MTIKNSFQSDDRLKNSFIVACSSGDNCEAQSAVAISNAKLLISFFDTLENVSRETFLLPPS